MLQGLVGSRSQPYYQVLQSASVAPVDERAQVLGIHTVDVAARHAHNLPLGT